MAYTPRNESPKPWIKQGPKVWNKRKSKFNYQSQAWRNTSYQFRIDNPLCVLCLDKEIIKPSEVTDHIAPITQGGDPWNPKNYQALCQECHNKKSRSERNYKTLKTK